MTAPRKHGHDEAREKHADVEAREDPTPERAADDDEPEFTWDEYLEQKRALEAQLLTLERRVAARYRWPRWMYHKTERPRVVGSQTERQALGAGWQVRPV